MNQSQELLVKWSRFRVHLDLCHPKSTTAIHVILLQAMERIKKKRHKEENEIKLNTEAIKTYLSLCVNIVYLKLKILLSQ